MLRLPSLWSPQICLRCQYRLAIRARARIAQQRPQHQPRWFSQNRRLRQAGLAQSVPIIDEGPFYDGPNISYEPFDGPVIRYEHHGGPSPEQKRALKHALGVNALGKPADVFVFEPEQETKRVHEFETSVKQKSYGEHDLDEEEILKRIQDGVGIVDIEDACAHIDEIRYSWEKERYADSSFVTEGQYIALHEKLCQGFTKVQLQSYVNREELRRNIDETDLGQDVISDSYTRSSWERGETRMTEIHAPPFSAGVELAPAQTTSQFAVTLKEDIAGSILDDIWQISPPSRELEIGELEIRLHRMPFDLIMKHRKTVGSWT